MRREGHSRGKGSRAAVVSQPGLCLLQDALVISLRAVPWRCHSDRWTRRDSPAAACLCLGPASSRRQPQPPPLCRSRLIVSRHPRVCTSARAAFTVRFLLFFNIFRHVEFH